MPERDKRNVSRVLIANRGEIARRIIRTCTAMGIETVAVYSDVDAHLPHVREATFSEAMGGPTSYLSTEAIVSAALRSGADSVHPGYGFLSENPLLPEALLKHGITFIGPTPASIRTLGSKTGAKQLAATANVPVAATLLLTSSDLEPNARLVEDFGARVGFPVIIKAAAGGGGRGMRLVTPNSDLRQELESAAREALKAFGSPEIFVEKYIPVARHVEVQIVGDDHGDVVALGTRDCSLQRSNQKIIEEAPATGLKPGVAEEISLAACRLGKAAGYTNVGTVEFLYTPEGSFYFLEVNTRLQVEHPVTELVTGLDLVRLQIEIARGSKLTELLPGGIPPRSHGHAIEARLCAEEYKGRFVSSTGVLLEVEIPTTSELPGTVRCDMGFEVCSEVSHYYDSLLGKLIVHSDSRREAIALLHDILKRSRFSGVSNNRALLLSLLSTDGFISQRHSIRGTTELLPSEQDIAQSEDDAFCLVSALRLYERRSSWSATAPWSAEANELGDALRFPFMALVRGQLFSSEAWFSDSGVTVQLLAPRPSLVSVRAVNFCELSHGRAKATLAVREQPSTEAYLLRDGSNIWIHTEALSLCIQESFSQSRASVEALGSSELLISSPLPGKVVTLAAQTGQNVNEGDVLLVLDSMKMEHPIRTTRSGTVTAVAVQQGSIVQAGTVLVKLS